MASTQVISRTSLSVKVLDSRSWALAIKVAAMANDNNLPKYKDVLRTLKLQKPRLSFFRFRSSYKL